MHEAAFVFTERECGTRHGTLRYPTQKIADRMAGVFEPSRSTSAMGTCRSPRCVGAAVGRHRVAWPTCSSSRVRRYTDGVAHHDEHFETFSQARRERESRFPKEFGSCRIGASRPPAFRPEVPFAI